MMCRDFSDPRAEAGPSAGGVLREDRIDGDVGFAGWRFCRISG